MLTGVTIGLTLVSHHLQDTGWDCERNPGIYAISRGGISGGLYKNSLCRVSGWGGYTFQTANEQFALTVGAVYGYQRRQVEKITPFELADDQGSGWKVSSHQEGFTAHKWSLLLVPSWKIPVRILSVNPRLSLMGSAIAISVEKEF